MTILSKARAEADAALEVQILPSRIAAGTFIGRRVVSCDQEDLGVIENLMINVHTGRVEYVVIRFEGFFGLGGKLFAVPFRHLTLQLDDGIFLLDRSRQAFESMPGFDKMHWPYTNSHFFKRLDMLWGSNVALQV